ncbi:GntP family permease [Cryobacterium sp. CG_9.6]|uniref:GntP family permease n=1 Tax=Cryobacterium sp. CG_9.6 TaxID=2760710 RepID=UPI0024731131|nr:GntP family permease [Cryobacterium sp. CG_9.6]MDH6236841.1 GntP family gluconate:H+ symporter [Cryobacterium sp. CG_9.6]
MLSIAILVTLVAAIVFATAKLKINPFLALLGAALVGGFAFRLPVDTIAPTMTTAFGATLGNIGLIILFGTIIGVILERTGSAIAMAEALIRLLGTRFPTLTMSIIGFIVSIPVFCDSGFVILNSLKKAIAARTQVSLVAMTIALMTGLYATHVFVPPTPGPLAAAGNLNIIDQLGLIIGFGLIAALVSAAAGLLWANRFLKKDIQLLPEPAGEENDLSREYDQLRSGYGTLPNAFLAFLPILAPIVLICIASIAKLPAAPFGDSGLFIAIVFLGTPVIALMVGLVAALFLLRGANKLTTFGDNVNEGIRISAPILLITASGAAFGSILAASDLTDYLGSTLSTLGLGLVVPFVISAALKTAQGSSTVAMVTTSVLLLPLLPALGLDSDMGRVLSVLAIGAGAMVVSHANDSFFWVVSQLSRIPVATAYRTLTPATAIQGVAGFAAVWVMGLIVL